MEEFVLHHGQSFKQFASTRMFGMPMQCFRNATLLVLGLGDVPPRYALPEGMFPVAANTSGLSSARPTCAPRCANKTSGGCWTCCTTNGRCCDWARKCGSKNWLTTNRANHMALEDHAKTPDGLPLLWIPPDSAEEECDECHCHGHLKELEWVEGRLLCEKCRAKRAAK